MFCAIYLRKSRADIETEAHGGGETLLRHKTALLELAQKMNITVGAVYEEIVSGETISARPQMKKLLSEVGAGVWEGVLVMEIERLARGDTMDQGLVAQTFRASGTKIITPLKIYDPTNEFDEEYFEFGLFMARREFTVTNRRLVRGREASAKEGKFLGSIAPFGYKKVKLENEKGFSLEIVEEQARIVRAVFEWYVYGTEINGIRKRLGFKAIAKRLNELCILPQGKSEHWTSFGIRNILTNPVYIGKIRYGYRKVKKQITPDGVKKKTRQTAKDAIISNGRHEPIVSEELFYKAQQLISQNSHAPVKYKTTLKNPLAGLIYCAKCGHLMTYRSAEGGKRAYIACNTAGCKCVSAPLEPVEKRLLEILNVYMGGYCIKKTASEHTGLNSEIEDTVLEMKSKISEYRLQLENIYDYFERGIYDEKTFKQRLKEVGERISELEEKIALQSSELLLMNKRPENRSIPAVGRLTEIYGDIDIEGKNRLLKSVFARIVYEKNAEENRRQSPDSFNLGVFLRLPEKN